MPDKKGNQSETEISKEIGEFLTLNHIPNWKCHVLHGKFQAFGSKIWRIIKTGIKGMSDRQFPLDNGSGQTLYLEVKKPGGKQSSDQKDFQKMCDERSIPYFVATSIQDVVEILEIYNMLKVRF